MMLNDITNEIIEKSREKREALNNNPRVKLVFEKQTNIDPRKVDIYINEEKQEKVLSYTMIADRYSVSIYLVCFNEKSILSNNVEIIME